MDVYDFDGTIYDGDSSIDFYLFCLKKNIKLLRYIPGQVLYSILYKFKIKTKEEFKQKFFSFLCEINNVDDIVTLFWKTHEKKIKYFYLNKNHSNDVIISASPFFLLNPICEKLKIKKLIASNFNKNNGTLSGKNCYGINKVDRFREIFGNISIENFYTDSLSDLPLIQIANNSYIVKKNKIIKYQGSIINAIKEEYIEEPPIYNFVRLANEKGANLEYTLDGKDLLKDIYRSVF